MFTKYKKKMCVESGCVGNDQSKNRQRIGCFKLKK